MFIVVNALSRSPLVLPFSSASFLTAYCHVLWAAEEMDVDGSDDGGIMVHPNSIWIGSMNQLYAAMQIGAARPQVVLGASTLEPSRSGGGSGGGSGGSGQAKSSDSRAVSIPIHLGLLALIHSRQWMNDLPKEMIQIIIAYAGGGFSAGSVDGRFHFNRAAVKDGRRRTHNLF